jgi:hypothetical protein
MRFAGSLGARALLAAGLAVGAPTAGAVSVGFFGSSGLLAASVAFSQAAPGGNLTVTLTNTGTADTLLPSDVLTAVFFSLAGDPVLTRISAVLGPGSSVIYDPDGQPPGGVVGGEWAYRGGLTGLPLGASAGISSVGVGLFGPGDRFPGSDLAPPASPDGINYGIVSAGDDPATGNPGLTGSGGQIKNSVVFTLGVPVGYALGPGSVSNVSFQYGSSLEQPNLAAIPEPGAAGLLAGGLAALGALGWRRRSAPALGRR